MRFVLQIVLVLLVLITFTECESNAQPSDATVYSRQRARARAGAVWNGGPQYSGHYQGYHRSYLAYQPAIAGSWYARPYPHHFDYYRQRFSAPQRTLDCPCAKMPAEP